MKKLRYILIAIIAVLLIGGIALAAVLLSQSGYVTTDDPDALYDYTIKRDGNRLTVTVNGAFPDGALFHAAGNTGAVTVTEKKSTAAKAVFELRAAAEGADPVSLYLEKSGKFTVRSYVISLYLLVDEKLDMDVTGSKSTALTDAQSKTDGDGIGYLIDSPGPGLCEITLLKQKPGDSFTLISEDRSLFRILDQSGDDTRQTFRLAATAVGETAVSIQCRNRGLQLTMNVSVEDTLQFLVSDIRESDYASDAE